jgi:3-methylcrotonyl-CoA carboxylase alpha subunit
MFDKILIANRGEIACRVMRTARRLGIATVAVYSEADAGAAHVAMADEAICIGAAPASESYLAIDAIIDAAWKTGALVVHPGYGFLSENAEFAEACARSDITFIGPSPETIRVMGSKLEAKRLVKKAGVPVVPGYHAVDPSEQDLREAAELIGLPLLIKASAGGGGRGMRLVREAGEFDEALAGARREALAAFGDDKILLEYYIGQSRHIEVQVFGDSAGQVIHLFERDCSVQRRHQKILEESPAPGLSPQVREAMASAAVQAAQAVDYVGAGTVEFIMDLGRADDIGNFYFLEMNTRLQVEHPVTEMVSGIDLVEWQLRIAAGARLPIEQGAVKRRGHAIEARIYAEDPRQDYLPSVGTLTHLRFPEETTSLRIDSGVREGDTVSPYYDPMIAKVIAWGSQREDALRRLRRALDQIEVVGVTTNRDLLAAITVHFDYASGAFDTTFLDEHRDELAAEAKAPLAESLVLAAIAELMHLSNAAQVCGAAEDDPYSPWRRRDGWRLFGRGACTFRFADQDEEITVRTVIEEEGYQVDWLGVAVPVRGVTVTDGVVSAEIRGRRVFGRVVRVAQERHVIIGGLSRRLVLGGLDTGDAAAAGGGRLTAPLPSTVVKVHVELGQKVSRGDALMVLEAMKMEHVVVAPGDGVIGAIHYASGEQVLEGAELIAFETA